VSINAGVKVFHVIVGEIRCFEFADVELEAVDGIETGMGQLIVGITDADIKIAALVFICEEVAE
jgi:hypothetical protein